MEYEVNSSLTQRRRFELQQQQQQQLQQQFNQTPPQSGNNGKPVEKKIETPEDNPEKFVKDQIKKLRTELIWLISLPFLFLLSFGGDPAVFTFGFGSVVCYILDLLEAVEVSYNFFDLFF